MVKWVHLRGNTLYLLLKMLTLVQLLHRRNWLKIIIQKKSTSSRVLGKYTDPTDHRPNTQTYHFLIVFQD